MIENKPHTTSDTGGDTPLVNKRFPWPNLPFQADTGNGPRGEQEGYNLCNATTQNQQSMCQTGFLNSIEEFCLWGSPKPKERVANVEQSMVAFCTKKKFGARLLTAGSLKGVQFIKTPGYAEVVGMIDQTSLNLVADDPGGEEDSHAADQRGNPLGGLIYSSAFSKPGGPAYTQVIEWNYFVGGGVFCFKACDPAGPDAATLCEHIYDRIGCVYNSPANYTAINGTFLSCKGDNQVPVGHYVEGGVSKVWKQPAESQGPIQSVPYTPVVPPTSECISHDPKSLWPELLASSPSVSQNTSGPPLNTTATSGLTKSVVSSASLASSLGSPSPLAPVGRITVIMLAIFGLLF